MAVWMKPKLLQWLPVVKVQLLLCRMDLWAWMEHVCGDPIVRSKPSLALLRLLLEADLSFAQISALLLWKCVTRSHESANRLSREAVTTTIFPLLRHSRDFAAHPAACIAPSLAHTCRNKAHLSASAESILLTLIKELSLWSIACLLVITFQPWIRHRVCTIEEPACFRIVFSEQLHGISSMGTQSGQRGFAQELAFL